MISKKKFYSIILTLIITVGTITFNQFKSWLNQSVQPQSTNTAEIQINDNHYPTWSYDQYPDYYAIIGEAQIDLNNFPEKGKITYTGKDEQGRTQAVYGTITLNMIQQSSAEERPDFKRGDNPSGYPKNQEVDVETSTGTYHGWFWNRSHLVADRLGGEATSNNAITGTRMQNVGNRSNSGGIYYIEELTVDFLRANRSQHVYYSATPIYYKNEMIPRYVIVDVKSDNSTLNQRVITFNNQNGYTINYYDGSFIKN